MTKETFSKDREWQAYQDSAGKDVLFTNFAYEQNDKKMAEIAEKLPKSHELILMTDHVQDTNEFSYRCAVFIDRENKEIIFANAGTRPGFHKKAVDDLVDDGRLIQQDTPHKLEMAKVLNRMILDSLGNEFDEYKFHYTGHSLGAAVAELAAADMDIELQKRRKGNDATVQVSAATSETASPKIAKKIDIDKQVSATTFENPGTGPIIDKMYRGTECARHVKSIIFNNRPNAINSLNKQAGEVYTIISDKQNSISNARQMFFSFLSLITKNAYSIISKICDFLSMGSFSNQIQEHKLSNFEKVIVESQGTAKFTQEGQYITAAEVLELKRTTSELDIITSHNRNANKHNTAAKDLFYDTSKPIAKISPPPTPRVGPIRKSSKAIRGR